MATTADCAVVATVFPSLNVTGSCCNSSLPITCDGGRVTRLDLGSNALTGALPSSIGRLTKLTYLEVSSNSLSGPLPESLGSLASLTELSLDRNAFSGPIPESFGKLTKLIKLSMYNNRLSGNLPSSLGNLRKLDVLYLDNNTLAGPIGPVTSLTELSSLGLSYNQFSDSVKQLKKLTKLGSVWLESNLQLTGDFPSTVSPATHCSMSDTDICTSSATLQKACNVPACPTSKSCTIPVEAFPTLDFGDNCCTSGYVTCNNSQITAVSLSGANLRGSLPSSLGDLRSITSL
ncbi:hypothetical protein HK105_206414 [Polyrhizophydium stewartii]|uniref:Disease resistance R13L4/SHOC-2-like LRR domain-containing protein n=1 Tax=Polyrhizophydium stewartii TaxID=2732419 RepID=A0ABR4N3P3_9FUNG